MTRRSRASLVIKIAGPACGALVDEHQRPAPLRPSENVRPRILPRSGRRSFERPVTAEPVHFAIVGHATLADVEGRPGAWRRVLTDPHQLAGPVTGARRHPGRWLIDWPPKDSFRRECPGLTGQEG